MTTPKQLLEVHEVTITYAPPVRGAESITPIHEFTLDVAVGELVCLAGRSGSGKTTVLSMAAGLLEPSSGTVSWSGHDVYAMSETDRASRRRAHLGIMFQGGALVASLTALENAVLTAIPGARRRERRRIAARGQSVLTEVGLVERARHFPSQLSGGEQHRVALARALYADPPLLVVDEPTAALDQSMSSDVVHLLLRARSPQRGLLVASHDPQVLEAADRVVRIE